MLEGLVGGERGVRGRDLTEGWERRLLITD